MYYAVEIPWGFFKPAGVETHPTRKIQFYKGDKLPASLQHLRAPEFSRERWHEDELNGKLMPIEPGEVTFTPKPHQLEAGKKIARSYNAGWSGFLLADKTGVGKTLSALTGLAMIAKLEGKTQAKKAKLLVVCPKSVLPQWRQTLKNFRAAHPYLRVMVMNYHQLQKLLQAPPAPKPKKGKAKKTRQVAREGKPIIDFDYIVFDESQHLKNYPTSTISLIAEKVAGLDKAYRKGASPFVIFSSATPGSSPLNFAVMSGFMSRLLDPKLTRHVAPKDWGNFLIAHDFAVKKGKSGYSWAPLPWAIKAKTAAEERAYQKALKEAKAVQRKDAARIGKALVSEKAPFIMRSPKDIAGWPEQQLAGIPVELTAQQRIWYEEAWTQFRRWLKLTPAHKDPKGALVEQLRYRQKTSLLRVDSLSELAAELVEQGNQVYISCEFIETIEQFTEQFSKKKISVAEISGRTVETREDERLKFQRGEAQVVLCTVVAGISLHAEETLPDGTKATSADRITILADVRQNPLDSIQALGRAHRDGKNSLAYIPYIEESVDRKVVNSFINKMINTEVMTGKSVESAEQLEAIFREAAAGESD